MVFGPLPLGGGNHKRRTPGTSAILPAEILEKEQTPLDSPILRPNADAAATAACFFVLVLVLAKQGVAREKASADSAWSLSSFVGHPAVPPRCPLPHL